MHIINARNVNDAFINAWWYIRAAGVEEPTRAGPVLVAPWPVITKYACPTERVLFNPKRDANGIFHLMEALWMLAGDSQVAWLAQFNARIATYAERDGNIHGAYGARWRWWFGRDQLLDIINMLRTTPNTRQAVLQMWDPCTDLHGDWADRPCNTAVYFDRRGGVLNMTVTCRSNDILWGCYGANAVHFSVLQEFIAAAVGVPVGVYRQFSNNWHAYKDNPQVREFLRNPPFSEDYNNVDYYRTGAARVVPLLAAGELPEQFLHDCARLTQSDAPPLAADKYETAFFRTVAAPLCAAYLARKGGQPMQLAEVPDDCDWKLAFQQWCNRRDENGKQGE